MSSKLARSNKNKGISLVELLIVVVVIGIIAAILLPAVGGPRVGPSRRTTCLNNIRNIALACTSYESTNGQFPAAVSSHSESFWVRILPMLDQVPLYDDFRAEPDYNLAKDMLAGVEMEVLRCTSTPTSDFESTPFAGSPLTTQAVQVPHRVISKTSTVQLSFPTRQIISDQSGLEVSFRPRLLTAQTPAKQSHVNPKVASSRNV